MRVKTCCEPCLRWQYLGGTSYPFWHVFYPVLLFGSNTRLNLPLTSDCCYCPILPLPGRQHLHLHTRSVLSCPTTAAVTCPVRLCAPVITVVVLVCVVLAGCSLGAAAECGAEGVLWRRDGRSTHLSHHRCGGMVCAIQEMQNAASLLLRRSR